jgi:hypothetical protein
MSAAAAGSRAVGDDTESRTEDTMHVSTVPKLMTCLGKAHAELTGAAADPALQMLLTTTTAIVTVQAFHPN